MRDGLKRLPKAYVLELMLSGGYSMTSSIIIGDREVKSIVRMRGVEGVEFEDTSPTVARALIQIAELSKKATAHFGIYEAEAKIVSEMVARKMEEE